MFENIVGHDEQKHLLCKEIENGNISHAYLFTGKKGIGKSTMAKEFAKNILKVDNLETSPDFKYISKREDKKDIIVEQIRNDLIDDIYTSPSNGDRKVYIIDDAQMLNMAAQNALLKTLEEPPKYVVVILISSSISAFLPTVISRVNKISFNGIKKEYLNEYIYNNCNITLDDNVLNYVDGSIGFAMQVINDNLIEKFKIIDNIYSYMNKKDGISALKYSENIDFQEQHMLDYLEYILFNNFKYTCTKFVEKAIIRLKYNGNYDIVIDNMILKIIDVI